MQYRNRPRTRAPLEAVITGFIESGDLSDTALIALIAYLTRYIDGRAETALGLQARAHLMTSRADVLQWLVDARLVEFNPTGDGWF